jgi:hypothetical protein
LRVLHLVQCARRHGARESGSPDSGHLHGTVFELGLQSRPGLWAAGLPAPGSPASAGRDNFRSRCPAGRRTAPADNRSLNHRRLIQLVAPRWYRGPLHSGGYWIPAFAGMTALAADLVTPSDDVGGSGFPEGAITLAIAMARVVPWRVSCLTSFPKPL